MHQKQPEKQPRERSVGLGDNHSHSRGENAPQQLVQGNKTLIYQQKPPLEPASFTQKGDPSSQTCLTGLLSKGDNFTSACQSQSWKKPSRTSQPQPWCSARKNQNSLIFIFLFNSLPFKAKFTVGAVLCRKGSWVFLLPTGGDLSQALKKTGSRGNPIPAWLSLSREPTK